MEATFNWAIVDAGAEPELFSLLEEHNPPAVSLYAEPIAEELARLAPYLLQVNAVSREWLMQRQTPWGFWLKSQATMRELRQHWRKYLHVQIPDEEKPVYFRFYDPRNIWSLLAVLSPWEQHRFLGPVEAIATHWRGETHQQEFAALRAQFPANSGPQHKLMRLSHPQIDALNQAASERYIDELVEKMAAWPSRDQVIDRQHVAETFYWLQQQGITDDRSICGLFYLFCQRGCLAVETLPAEFKAVLCSADEDGAFKAETLLLQELGQLPL